MIRRGLFSLMLTTGQTQFITSPIEFLSVQKFYSFWITGKLILHFNNGIYGNFRVSYKS